MSRRGNPLLDNFYDLAGSLAADKDDGRFEETVRKIASKTPRSGVR